MKPNQPLATDSFSDQFAITDLFEEFLNKCTQYGGPANEVELIIGKIRDKFANLDPLYKNSTFFKRFLIEKVMPKIPKEPWQGMKILSDDLKRHAARENLQEEEMSSTSTAERIHQQLIREFENSIIKISKKIKRLNTEEVDMNNDKDSSYLKVSRYRKKRCELYNRISQLKNDTSVAEMITFSGTKFPAINQAIEQYCNSSKNFPNYHGVFKIIRATNSGENLGLSESQIHEIAESAFQDLGCKMKMKRSRELREILLSYTESEKWEDPALKDPELNQKLLENEKRYGHRLDEVINGYAIKQEQHHSNTEVIVDTDEECSEDEDETSDSMNTTLSILSIGEGISEISLREENSLYDTSQRRLPASGVTNNQSPIQKRSQNVQDIRKLGGPCSSKSLVIKPIDQK